MKQHLQKEKRSTNYNCIFKKGREKEVPEMGQLWVPLLVLALYQHQQQCHGQILNFPECNFHYASFDKAMAGKLVLEKLEFDKPVTTPLTVGQCISKCANYKNKECKSINYFKNGTIEGCELLRNFYGAVRKDFVRNVYSGWVHYGPDPNQRFVSFYST